MGFRVGDRSRVVGCLAVVAAIFAPSITFGFVNWDDDVHVYRNPLIVDPQGRSLVETLTTPSLGYPSPLTIATYRLEHAIVGLAPWLYHLDNVVLHLVVCWLVQRVGGRLGLSLLGRLAAMLVFGLHPAVVEPVAWVTGRKDLLAAAFILSAAGALADLRAPLRRRIALTTGTTFLAWLAKPTALFVTPLAFAWTRLVARRSWRESAVTALPGLLVSVPFFVVALVGQRKVGAIDTARPILGLLRDAWYALGFHLGLVFGIQTPSAKHLVERPSPFRAAVDLLPFAFAFALALALRAARSAGGDHARRDVIRGGLVFAILAYLPSSNLIPLSRYLADSYVYLPLVGLAWTAGALVEAARDRLAARTRAARLAAAGAAMIALGAGASSSFARLATWRDGIALWSEVAATEPPSPNVCRLLGNAYNEAGRHEEALTQYRGCVATFGPEMFDTNIAITLFELGRRDEARAAFSEVLARHPGDPKALRYLALLGPR